VCIGMRCLNGSSRKCLSTPLYFDESHCIMQRILVGVGVDVGAVSRLTGFISPFTSGLCIDDRRAGYIDRRPIAITIWVVDDCV